MDQSITVGLTEFEEDNFISTVTDESGKSQITPETSKKSKKKMKKKGSERVSISSQKRKRLKSNNVKLKSKNSMRLDSGGLGLGDSHSSLGAESVKTN